MALRYPAALVLTLALASSPAGAKPQHHRRPQAAAPVPAGALYSRRALKRAQIILQLELLELRAARLERVRRAILQHLAPEQILKI